MTLIELFSLRNFMGVDVISFMIPKSRSSSRFLEKNVIFLKSSSGFFLHKYIHALATGIRAFWRII